MAVLSPTTLARRQRLHERYAELSRLPDASRLAYLNGPEVQWSLDEVAALWRQADGDGQGQLLPQNNLYLHVPFCKSICSFCNYERLRPSSPVMLQEWEARLFHTIETLAPAAAHLTFHSFYMGGGTPSVLPPDQLDRVLSHLQNAFNWHPNATWHFEFDPAVLNAAKLDVLVKHGVTHYSFGIQTLQAPVVAAHNRGVQTIETVAKRFEEFEERGIDAVSCDFLAGLAGTTPQDILREVETVISRFQPGWVDVFTVTPTQEYVNSHFSGSYDNFYAHLEPFQKAIPSGLARIAETHDYKFLGGQGHHSCLQRPERLPSGADLGGPAFGYTQLVSEAQRPVNLLGLGPSARSQIFGLASFQNRAPSEATTDYKEPIYLGHPKTRQAEALAYLAHDLRDTDVVNRTHFQDLFGADIDEIMPTAMAGWTHEGVASATKNKIRLAPHDRQTRTRSLLWLVDEAHIEHEIASHMALDLSPTGLSALLQPLPLETRLSGGVVLAAVTHSHLHLRVPGDKTHRVRVTPPLDLVSPPGLVILTGPQHSEGQTALMGAVRQLQKLIARNHSPWVPDHT